MVTKNNDQSYVHPFSYSIHSSLANLSYLGDLFVRTYRDMKLFRDYLQRAVSG